MKVLRNSEKGRFNDNPIVCPEFFLVWSRDSQIVKLSDYFVKHSQSIDIDHQPEFVMRVLAKKKLEMSVWHIYYGAMSLFSVSISSPLIFMHVSFVVEFSQVWTMELCLRNCVFLHLMSFESVLDRFYYLAVLSGKTDTLLRNTLGWAIGRVKCSEKLLFRISLRYLWSKTDRDRIER